MASLVGTFKASCQSLRENLLAGRLATPEELDACYPGKASNDKKGLHGWARCYGLFTGFARRIEIRSQSTRAESAQKRAAVLEAIAETPETVELVQRDAEGHPRTLTVYQKSDVALRVIHGVNVLLAELVDGYQVLSKRGEPNDSDLLIRILAAQSYLQRVIVWVATTRGPGLPFPEEELHPQLPDDPVLNGLHGLDFHALAQAFHRVNVAGFAALEASTGPKTRADWSVFWSGLEFELKTPVPRLRRDRGLLSLVATASEQARGRQEAYDRAERERKKAG